MFNLPPTGLNAIDPEKTTPQPIGQPNNDVLSNDVPSGSHDKGNNSIFDQIKK